MKCLAFIWNAEDYAGKEKALANIKFITGPYKNHVMQSVITTGIYRYYYWGVTLEEIEIDSKGNVLGVQDITKETCREFNLGLIYALSYNEANHEVLGSNGVMYKLDQSIFYNHCKSVCEYIFSEIATAYNFSLRMYTKDGAILDLLFDKNVSQNTKSYKYAMNRGFITNDKNVLKTMVPKTESGGKSDVLNQSQIDKLIQDLNE